MVALFGFGTPTSHEALGPGDLFVCVSHQYQALCLRAQWGEEAVAVILREGGRIIVENFPYASLMSSMPADVAKIEGDFIVRPTTFEPAPFLAPATHNLRAGTLILTPDSVVLSVLHNYRPLYFTMSGKHVPQPSTNFAYSEWSLVWRHKDGEATLVSFPYVPPKAD